MQRYFRRLFWILALGAITGYAASDMQASDPGKIRYLSQKIATDYLLLFSRKQDPLLQERLQQEISTLSETLRQLARYAKGAEVNNILDYLSYNKDQIRSLIQEKPSDTSVDTLLDYTQALSEGAEAITNISGNHTAPQYEIRYRLYRIATLYLITHLGIERDEEKREFTAAVQTFARHAERIPSLDALWQRYSPLLTSAPFIPNLLDLMLIDMDQQLSQG